MNRRGFTIVELVVVMTILAILMTLGVISFSSAQADARDAKRAADISAIAKGLEVRYVRGNTYGTAAYIKKGSYPSTDELRHAEGLLVSTITPTQTTSYITLLLPGARAEQYLPPGASGGISTTFIPICTTACGAAEDATRIASTVLANVYVYEPVTATNQVCINTECVRFNLYYKKEDGTVVKETSKRQ